MKHLNLLVCLIGWSIVEAYVPASAPYAQAYPAPSYPAPSYPAPSYPAPSYPAPAYPSPSYSAQTYQSPPYPAPGYPPPAPAYPVPSYPSPPVYQPPYVPNYNTTYPYGSGPYQFNYNSSYPTPYGPGPYPPNYNSSYPTPYDSGPYHSPYEVPYGPQPYDASEDYQTVNYYPKIFGRDYGASYPAPNIYPQDLLTAYDECQSSYSNRNNYEAELVRSGLYVDNENPTAIGRANIHYTSKPRLLFETEPYDGVFEEITYRVASRLKMDKKSVHYSLPKYSPYGLKDTSLYKTCSQFRETRCLANYKYRTLDGSCNNLNHPNWGRAFACYQRFIPPDYADGIAAPRAAYDGAPLPNPRVLSTVLHSHKPNKAKFYTHMLMQWGQMVDHDITFTKHYLASSRYVLDCCGGKEAHGNGTAYALPPATHPACMPIPIPEGDYLHVKYGKTCLNFIRSASCMTCNLGPRQQVNQVTSFIDGSSVYSSSEEELLELLNKEDNAMLAVQSTGYGDLLTSSLNPKTDQCSHSHSERHCYRSGDIRINQHPGVVVIQTLLTRYHNILANRMRAVNPHWDAKYIFDEVRRIVIAQMQFITFREYLHLVIGPTMMTYFKLWPLANGRTYYDSRINPTLYNEFTSAAYRYGHSLVSKSFYRLGSEGQFSSYRLKENYFNPEHMRNGSFDFILRGLSRQQSMAFDPYLVPDLTNYLYKVNDQHYQGKQGSYPGGPYKLPYKVLDLAAINIQRGREHGIAGYTSYIKYCFDVDIYYFEELYPFIPPDRVDRLRYAYKHVSDIDLWTGALHEYHMNEAVVGPTFGCLIGLQYYDTKFGDRYYFEHANEAGSFTDEQLQEIRKTWLSKIICLSGDYYQHSHLDVFQPASEGNPHLSCSEIPDIDLTYWKQAPPPQQQYK